MSITISRSYKYVDFNVSAPNNRGYLTIDTSSWIDYPWMFYELPSLKFEIYTETDGELLKYKNFTREIRTYNPEYSPQGVLNVTIDIRNVPEEFILRITPIFDNDAVAARNMLVENGIEDGDIWGSDQDVPTQLFNLNLEFIECEGEYIPPTPPVPPTHEETITGIPPITFDGSTGEPLVSWTILGNGSQSGTPTPDNPVMPTFCGVRTGNIVDIESWLKKYNIPYTKTGSTFEFSASSYLFSNPLWFSDEDITISLSGIVKALTGSNIRISTMHADGTIGRNVALGGTSDVRKTENLQAAGIRLDYTYPGNLQLSDIMLNTGSTALPYEPYGYKIPITCAGQTTPVYLWQVSTVRRIKKLVLTGSEDENWSGQAAGGGATRFRCTLLNSVQADTSHVTSICTHLPLGVEGGTWNTDDIYTISNNYLWLRLDISFTTVSALKTWLAAQYANGTPVCVWYVLATEQTGIVNEPLAKIGDYADELHSTDAGVSIPTVKGQNTLTVDTELQPSEMTITYTKEGQ